MKTLETLGEVSGAVPRPIFILASASPRRLELLRQVGLEPDRVVAGAIDETPRPKELPDAHASRLAREKLAVIQAETDRAVVLAADTVVACGRRILPKAESEQDARHCLALLSGRRHRVITAVAVRTPDGRVLERVVVTRVLVRRLSRADQEAYIASGEWRGKAGGYAIQGRAQGFIPWINGSYSNVVGLPLAETVALLASLGVVAGVAP